MHERMLLSDPFDQESRLVGTLSVQIPGFKKPCGKRRAIRYSDVAEGGPKADLVESACGHRQQTGYHARGDE